MPNISCGNSGSSSVTFQISCNKPARLAALGFKPNSEAIVAHI